LSRTQCGSRRVLFRVNFFLSSSLMWGSECRDQAAKSTTVTIGFGSLPHSMSR
jgi:hypothetical protein